MFVSPVQNSCIVKLESEVVPEVFVGKVQVEGHQLSVDHIGRTSFASSQVAPDISTYVLYFELVLLACRNKFLECFSGLILLPESTDQFRPFQFLVALSPIAISSSPSYVISLFYKI